MRKSFALLAAVLCLSLTACSHYRVTDSDTGDVYYTNDMCKVRKSQKRPDKPITFTEKVTGEEVTLQSPGVEKVTRGEYKAEVTAIKAASGM